MVKVARLPSFHIYLFARVFAAGAAFVILKLLVSALTRDQYGDWGYLRTVGAVLVPLISLSLPASMQRFYFDTADEAHDDRSDLVASVLWLSAASAGIILVAGTSLGLTGAVSPATGLFIAASVPAAVMVAFFDYLARTVENPVRYLQNRVVESGLFIAGLLIFLTVSDTSLVDDGSRFGPLWWAICLLAGSQWAVTVLNLVQRGPELARLRRPTLSRERAVELARFSAPLSGTFLVGWILSSSDVAVLRYRSESGEVADYVLAVGVVAFAALVTQAALVDWPPFFYRAMADSIPNSDRDLAVTRRLQLLLGAHVLGLLGLRLLASTAYRLLGADEFSAGLDLIGPLALGNFFYLAGSLLAVGLSHAKRTHLTLVIFAVPALANLGFNWWLVPEYGASAAAWTTLGSFVLFAALGWWLGARSYRFAQLPRVIAIAALATGISLI